MILFVLEVVFMYVDLELDLETREALTVFCFDNSLNRTRAIEYIVKSYLMKYQSSNNDFKLKLDAGENIIQFVSGGDLNEEL